MIYGNDIWSEKKNTNHCDIANQFIRHEYYCNIVGCRYHRCIMWGKVNSWTYINFYGHIWMKHRLCFIYLCSFFCFNYDDDDDDREYWTAYLRFYKQNITISIEYILVITARRAIYAYWHCDDCRGNRSLGA